MVTLPGGSTTTVIQLFFFWFQLKWLFSSRGQTLSFFLLAIGRSSPHPTLILPCGRWRNGTTNYTHSASC